jgi:hypothetical protein
MAAKSKDKFAKSATADLARQLGIELEYVNAAGKRIVSAPEVIRAVLAAMGYPVGNEQDAHDYVKILTEAENSRRLPAVLVVTQDHQPIQIAVNVRKGEGRLTWRLVLEDGGIAQEGTVNGHELVCGESSAAMSERSLVKLSVELPCGYHCFEISNDLDVLNQPPAFERREVMTADSSQSQGRVLIGCNEFPESGSCSKYTTRYENIPRSMSLSRKPAGTVPRSSPTTRQ